MIIGYHAHNRCGGEVEQIGGRVSENYRHRCRRCDETEFLAGDVADEPIEEEDNDEDS